MDWPNSNCLFSSFARRKSREWINLIRESDRNMCALISLRFSVNRIRYHSFSLHSASKKSLWSWIRLNWIWSTKSQTEKLLWVINKTFFKVSWCIILMAVFRFLYSCTKWSYLNFKCLCCVSGLCGGYRSSFLKWKEYFLLRRLVPNEWWHCVSASGDL